MSKRIPNTPSAPAPIGPYSVAVEAGDLVFISGQLAIDPEGGPTPETAPEQAELILANVSTLLEDLDLEPSDIVKTTIFLTDMGDFGAVNEVYGSFFASEPPARSTIGVAQLPKPQFKVEIEFVARR